MSVKHGLLAILTQGDCYGYQLRKEFEVRTGAMHLVNVGQVYNTLERLERDGLVARGPQDSEGHIPWQITPAGTAEVARWESTPTQQTSSTRNDLATKLAIVSSVPGMNPRAVLNVQRASSEQRLRAASERAQLAQQQREPFAKLILLDADVESALAELRWIDLAVERLASTPEHKLRRELSPDRPKRGRPIR